MSGKLTLTEIAERGELAPAVELRAFWDAFCDCDARPEDFEERMEAAGLIHLRSVTDEDLDDAFAYERGIEPGCNVWDLTEAGRASLSKGIEDE
jgi:hypothetical protein